MASWRAAAGLLAALLFASITCESCAPKTDELSLNVATLPGNDYYAGDVPCLLSGVHLLVKPTMPAGYSELQRIQSFTLSDESSELTQSLDLVVSDLGDPVCQLGANRLLVRTTQLPSNSMEGDRSPEYRFYVATFASGAAELQEVTPTNLQAAIPQRAPQFPAGYYSEDAGLTLFIASTNGLTAWQGKQVLKKCAEVDDVALIGEGFISGKRTVAAVESDSSALAMSFGDSDFRATDTTDFIGDAIGKFRRDHPGQVIKRNFVFNESLLCLRTADSLLVLGKAGLLKELPPLHYLDKTPIGTARDEATAQKAINDPLYMKDEGSHLSPEVISDNFEIAALDDSRLMILDVGYQRLVILELVKGSN